MAESRESEVFLAGLLWLDFVDTERADRGEQIDLVPDVEHLLEWMVAAGVLDERMAEDARRRFTGARGAALLRAAHDFRRILRGLGERLAAGDYSVTPTERAEINRVLAARPVYRELLKENAGFVQRVVPVSTSSPEALLADIAQSAADMLTSGDPSLVKRCEGPRCIMLFYDTTKNYRRRFCSASVCGNRAKAAARYQRIRESRRADGA